MDNNLNNCISSRETRTWKTPFKKKKTWLPAIPTSISRHQIIIKSRDPQRVGEKKDRSQEDQRFTQPQRPFRWSRRKSWASAKLFVVVSRVCPGGNPWFWGHFSWCLWMFIDVYGRKPTAFLDVGEIQWFFKVTPNSQSVLESAEAPGTCKFSSILRQQRCWKGSTKRNDFQHMDIFLEPVWSLAQLLLSAMAGLLSDLGSLRKSYRNMQKKSRKQASKCLHKLSEPRMSPTTSIGFFHQARNKMLPPQILQVTGKRPALHLNRPERNRGSTGVPPQKWEVKVVEFPEKLQQIHWFSSPFTTNNGAISPGRFYPPIFSEASQNWMGKFTGNPLWC